MGARHLVHCIATGLTNVLLLQLQNTPNSAGTDSPAEEVHVKNITHKSTVYNGLLVGSYKPQSMMITDRRVVAFQPSNTQTVLLLYLVFGSTSIVSTAHSQQVLMTAQGPPTYLTPNETCPMLAHKTVLGSDV